MSAMQSSADDAMPPLNGLPLLRMHNIRHTSGLASEPFSSAEPLKDAKKVAKIQMFANFWVSKLHFCIILLSHKMFVC